MQESDFVGPREEEIDRIMRELKALLKKRLSLQGAQAYYSGPGTKDVSNINPTDGLVSFSHLQKLETLLLELPKPLRDKLAEEYQELAYLYIYYFVLFYENLEKRRTNPDQKFYQAMAQALRQNQLQFGDSKQYPFYQKLQQIAFQRLIHKSRFRGNSNAENSRQYERALSSFVDMTNGKLVCDKCVGCNSFFYKYHPIESFVNQKDVKVHFLYHFDQNQRGSNQAGKVLPAIQSQTINLNRLHKQGGNLLKSVVDILNLEGGYIMIGCQKLDRLRNKAQLVNEQTRFYFSGVHFVIGEQLAKQDMERIKTQIRDLISPIQPKVCLERHLEIRFLPVLPSKFNSGFGLSEVYGSEGSQRSVILIAVKPERLYYKVRTGRTGIRASECISMDIFLTHQEGQSQNPYEMPQALSDQREVFTMEESFVTEAKWLKIFERHSCIYK